MTALTLHQLRPKPNSQRRRRRVGRGNASRGTYSGRGAKGQRSRTGGTRGIIRRSLKSLLERVPKQRGFQSRHAKMAVVNLDVLERQAKGVAVVTPGWMVSSGLIATAADGVKVLGQGTVSRAMTVQAHAFSATAKSAIEKVGGKAVVLGRPKTDDQPAERKG